MSSRATLAAALGKNFEVDTKFTVTVTANGKVVPRVPFVNKGDQGSQMSERFRKVSPPEAFRRTVRHGSACKWDRLHPNRTLCAALQEHLTLIVPKRPAVTPAQKSRLETGSTVQIKSGGCTVLLSDYVVHNAMP